MRQLMEEQMPLEKTLEKLLLFIYSPRSANQTSYEVSFSSIILAKIKISITSRTGQQMGKYSLTCNTDASLNCYEHLGK